MELTIVIIAISLLLSALFSGSEIAFVSTNKLRIQLQNIDNSMVGKILASFVGKPSRFLTAMLIGNNVVLVIYGIYFSALVSTIWIQQEWWGYEFELLVFLVQTILGSIIVLIFAEFIPKAVFSINAYRTLRALAFPLLIIHFILAPLVGVILALSHFILAKVFQIKLEKEVSGYDRVDLFHMINDEQYDEEEHDSDVDTEIFLNALEFANTKVRDCMIPRTEVAAIEINADVNELRELFVKSGHSKILVYRENIDQVIGYVHSIGLFSNPDSIQSIILPIPMAPESKQASNLLRTMIDKRRSMALIVDEFGGTSGIVTVEDIVEEIFGEIEDEHDQEELIEIMLNEHEYIFSARCEIEYINDKYNIDLPDGDYDTLGGYIIHIYERIPELGESILLDGFLASIRKMDGARIAEIHLKRIEEEHE